MLTRSLFRLIKTTGKFGAADTGSQKFTKKTVSSIKSEPKPGKKPKINFHEFPDELKKAGISPKSFDADMLEMYKKMKAQGADEYAKAQVDKMLDSEENTSDMFRSYLGESKSKVNADYKSLFPGKQKKSRMYQEEELPESIQQKISKEMRQMDEQEKFYNNKDLEAQKRKNFKDMVKLDSTKTDEKLENKEFGWLDKVKIEEPKSKEFMDMVNSWPKCQHDYFRNMEDRDDRKLYKEKLKLEKIQKARKIRDDYKDFKIGLEKKVTDDIHQKRSKEYLKKVLERILNDSSQVIQSVVLKNGFLNVHDLIISKSISVINVFFTLTFLDKFEEEFEKVKAIHEDVRRKLVHAAPYFRSKITQEAGLKYAPELRFYAYNPSGSSRQVLEGLEDDSQFWEEIENKSIIELDSIKPKLPGKYMKKNYYKEIGKPSIPEKDKKYKKDKKDKKDKKGKASKK